MKFSKKILALFDKSLPHTELQALQENLKHASLAIQEHCLASGISQELYTTYAVLGAPQAGKTSLLTQTDLKPLHPEEANKKATCEWWLSPKGGFLDFNGTFISESQQAHSLWPAFLKLAKKFFRQHPLKGIILTFSLPDLNQLFSNDDSTIALLKKIIADLNEASNVTLPIYFVITQCDRIVGFNEFFADLSIEERENYWGFPLESEHNATSNDHFKHEFDGFLRRLHQRLLWLLHHEPNIENKFLIRDFPIQIESHRKDLSRLIDAFSDPSNKSDTNKLVSIYFCSSVQRGDTLDNLAKTLTPLRTTLEHRTSLPARLYARPYFIKQLAPHLLEQSPALITSNTQIVSKTLPAGYIALMLPPLLAGVFWIKNHHLQQEKFLLANQTYQNFQSIIHRDLLTPKELVLALNNLHASLDYLNEFQPSLAMTSAKKSKEAQLQSTKQAYQQSLQKQLLPQVSGLLEKKLSAIDKNHPEQIYGLLKDYLMLSNPKYLDLDYLKRSLFLENATLFDLNSNEAENYFFHLTQAIDTPGPTLATNDTVVARARQLLDNVPYPLLAYALVKANTPETTVSFFLNPSTAKAFHFTNKKVGFSTIYTATAFTSLFNDAIPTMSKEVAEGSWILGDKKQSSLSKDELRELTQDVREFYIGDYLENWKNLSSGIQLNGFTNFNESAKVLSGLTGKEPAFLNFIQLMADNTSLAALSKKIESGSSSKLLIDSLNQESFEAYNQVYLNKPLLNTTLQSLQLLANDINTIASDPNSSAAALRVAQRYAENPTHNPLAELIQASNAYPEPVRAWLETIAYGNWKLLIDASHAEISSAWKKTIVPFYNSKLAERYPLLKQASADASIHDFKEFFSPNGNLALFFNEYLKPFVNTEKAQWEPVKVLNQSLPLSSGTLEQFERASIISRMFFSDGEHFGAHFDLEPLAMTPGLKNVTLHYDGKQVIDLPFQGHLSSWQWPISTPQAELAIEFNSNEGQSSSLIKQGEWAWFRLIEQSHLQATADPKKFELTFDSNGNSAKYLLETHHAINPFIPGILEQFKFPENL